MNALYACELIARQRGNAILVATMRSMRIFDQLQVQQPRVSSVPLMGAAASLGLGLALSQPQHRVIVVDGDASLLMQLGGLVTVSERRPANLVHFVVHNGTQFTGGANLKTPGESVVDFVGMARCAGYVRAETFSDEETLASNIADILSSCGPTFVELRVEAEDSTYSFDAPQREMPDLQFRRMGEESRALKNWLKERQ